MFRKAANLPLLQGADGEHGLLKLRLGKAGQKIGLILGKVGSAQKTPLPPRFFQPGIMARGQGCRVQSHGKIQKRTKFDFAIAQHIRVRRTAGAILR
ncbi:hypothetical protein SDC9_106918 [bioreactor metagenome]|uniref:Uncharacterized protein n=1 Tax=bioreactor metagenome TaxID=1076179 RepID=A0A645B635_9ZZZZ